MREFNVPHAFDKDNFIPLCKPSDKLFWIKKPMQDEFLCTCNESCWCMNNMAKGLWRNEPSYALDMINQVIKPQLLRLLGWKAGLDHDFSIRTGKSGKYLSKFIPRKL